MVCVYRGSGPVDAWMIAHWLERNGVAARVQGDLAAVRGEIPIGESWPSVWVADEDAQAARDAIAQQDQPTLVYPRWTCPGCGEDNEGNFGSCWSCDGDRPGG